MRYLCSRLRAYVDLLKIFQVSVLTDQVLPLRRGKTQAVAALQGFVFFQLLENVVLAEQFLPF